MCAHGEKGGKKEYVAYLTVRVGGGYVTVKVVERELGLRAVVGVVGRVPEPPRFGPRAPCWEVLKAFLMSSVIIKVEGNTYPLRRILSEAGFWFDRVAGVYRRAPPELQIADGGEPVDFYAEVGF